MDSRSNVFGFFAYVGKHVPSVLGIAKSELAVCVFMCCGVILVPQSHTYTGYVRNGLPSACRDACTCLINFPTHVAIQTEGCS